MDRRDLARQFHTNTPREGAVLAAAMTAYFDDPTPDTGQALLAELVRFFRGGEPARMFHEEVAPMAKYKIVGPRPVAGHAPGRTVDLELPAANLAALVKAGHIAPVTRKPKPADEVDEGTDRDYDPRKVD